MRIVERPPTSPEVLRSQRANEERQNFLEYLRLSPERRAHTRVPIMTLDRAEIAQELSSLFLGKCAFCEQSYARLQVHRFRPTNDADPIVNTEIGGSERTTHLYYGWLSDAWINLYPICGDCRPRRPNHFPVVGQRMPVPSAVDYRVYVERGDGLWPELNLAESPVFLDPCGSDDIARHLVPRADGALESASERGEVTIKHFNLNRKQLRDKRRQTFDRYATMNDDKLGEKDDYIGLWRIFRRQSQTSDMEMSQVVADAVAVVERAATRGRLTSIQLTNFKAIGSLTIPMPAPPDPTERLAQALLILGENAAGKSSILEAIALALIEPVARQDLVSKPEKLRLDPSFMGAPDEPQKESAQIRLTYENKHHSTLKIQGSKFSRSGRTHLPLVFGYGAYRHYLSDMHDWTPARPVISLFHSDSLLTNPEKWLLSLREGEFRSVVQALGAIFGVNEEIDVIYRDLNTNRCFVETQIDASGRMSRTPLSSVSSGFRTILALSCDIMRWLMDRSVNPDFVSLVAAEGIVLIDEVEAHLHPRWKIQIMKGLRTALPAMTFIVTTHDPLCLRGMRDNEVVVLSKVADQRPDSSIPVMVDRITALPKVATLTIQQLLTSDLFSLFSTDDPLTEESLARLGDHLAKGDGAPPTAAVKQAMEAVQKQIMDALPVGNSEVSRLVQEAVLEYLTKRRSLPNQQRRDLRHETKQRILAALELA